MITKSRNTSTAFRDQTWTVLRDSLWTKPGYAGPAISLSPVSSTGTAYSTPTTTESITYSVKRHHNACTHTKTKLSTWNQPYVGWVRGGSTGLMSNETYPSWRYRFILDEPVGTENIGHYGIMGGSFGLPTTYSSPVPWSTSWQADLSARALQAMWPGVSAQLSIPNFIYELKDMRDLTGQFKKLFRKFQVTSKRFERLSLKEFFKRAPISYMQGLAQGTLMSEFALRPFVSDLLNIQRGLVSAKQEAARLRRGMGKVLTSHYSYLYPCTPGNPGTPYSADGQMSVTTPYVSVRRKQYRWVEMSKYHATLDYSYTLGDFTNRHLDKLVWLDTFGINLNPKIVWDMLPWSFAVDWILKVGDFLDQFKYKAVTPIVKIHGFCHSVKHQVRIRRTVQYAYNLTLEQNPEATVAEECRDTYIRVPYIPNTYASLQTSGVSLREQILSLALLVTNATR